VAEESQITAPKGDEALLQEIRDRYRYASDAWREIREERKTDMRYVTGDPWDESDRKARADAGRPCINHDELNQYVNQTVNALRENKRGIKISPAGNGADEKTAELHQDLVRTIEYRSNAQAAYITAFQAAVEGSYGFFRVSRKYVSRKSFKQEIVVKNIANPDSVLYDPDCKEADWSDAQYCFVLDPISKEEFKRRFPRAQVKDFTLEDQRIAKDWIQDRLVLTAEYWRIEVKPGKLYELADGSTTNEPPEEASVVRERDEAEPELVQYITNGVEILERNPQPGEHIPIIPVLGKEVYVDEGGAPKRKLLSLIRLARDPQMSLAYLVSQQMEEAGLSPKAPWMGYKGQFESDREAWETSGKIPHAFLQADPIVDAAGGQILPLPTRVPFTPNIIAFEAGKDSCRRAIQAAMGTSPLPTALQRDSQKSGVAMERIQQSQAIGSAHFADNFDRALQFAGRVIESWIPVVYRGEREMGIVKPDESRKVIQLGDIPMDQGDHDVDVSTGPSYQSQRQAQQDFLDSLIANMKNLPVSPQQMAKLLSMAIQMKQLGPKGDEMADIISPSDKEGVEIPPQAQQAMAEAQQQMQALNAYAQQLEGELKKLQDEKAAKVVDNEYRMAIEKMRIEADITKAEINTKAQSMEERLKFVEDMWRQMQTQQASAEAAQQQRDHETQQAAAAAEQQAAQQQAEQAAQPTTA